jgi:hypothetical protein
MTPVLKTPSAPTRGNTDITRLASSVHRILLDPKSKEKTPA